MYKTVRKGDASLQYTILPQTDQFNAAAGFSPAASSKARPMVLRCTMALVVALIILSCIATPFLINQKDHNLFASTMLSMGRVEVSIRKNGTKTDAEDVVTDKQEVKLDDELSATSAKPEGNGLLGTSAPSSTPLSLTTTTTFFSTQQQTFSASSTTSRSSANPSSSTEVPRKLPRVTLKLRENETIPQMYMKAGIASYKKGNITTSVLAHGLSLEGLIFKTPEGTIKPWPQKWSFADPSSYFQWKGIRQVPRMVYFILGGLAALAILSIILMTYVQWRASRRLQRRNVEVLEIESQEEDESTLLGPETREGVDKE
ncbi:uncharacterized protein LOC124308190 [Neodiprion virginianus]|uniref:uncharacterized protein LOC124185239 n=1 Tax=Neodiprion fabricii TaxID=2872261 RepID=UPI001ED96B37|nr:uncharacterized protein LOC124185239 [Neodiprion fabricii]XP_046626604.1 uncharacterized protein LOC124308190 [Neodiprion virginianus]